MVSNRSRAFGAVTILLLSSFLGPGLASGATTVVRTIAVPGGGSPVGVGANPLTHKVYVSVGGIGNVTVIDGDSDTIAGTIPLVVFPADVAVNSATNKIYVAENGNGTGAKVWVIDGATDTVLTSITVGAGPRWIGVNTITNRIYVGNEVSNTVSVIDGATNGVIATVPMGGMPGGIGVHTGTNLIYVGVNGPVNGIRVINGATNAVLTTIPVPGLVSNGLAVDSAANRAFVTNQGDNTLRIVDTSTQTLVGSAGVGSSPYGVAINPARKRAYTANYGASTASVVNTVLGALEPPDVALALGPRDADFNSASGLVYVADFGAGTVSVLQDVGDVCSDSSSAHWWNTAWGRRRPLTVNNGAQLETFASFPVLVKLDSSRIDYGRTQNAGQDLRFVDADDLTVLDHEIELWNETGTSYVWVRVPSIPGGSLKTIYMYFDNPVAPDGQNTPAVWASGYRGVWHLKENPGGAPPQMKDSTSNVNHGTTEFSPVQAPGQIDGSLQFDGTSERDVNVPDSASLRLATEMTVSGWARTTASSAQSRVIVAKWKNVGPSFNYWLGKLNATQISFAVDGGGPASVLCPLNLINDGAWHQVVGVAEATGTLRFFVDGAECGTAAFATPIQTGNSELRIGRSPDVVLQDWDGGIDEVRVEAIARSADWIRAQYLSTSDALVSFGAETGTCNFRSIGTAATYVTGTVTATNGSRTITGAGTAWQTANRGRGDVIRIAGTDYTVFSVDSQTQLTLVAPFNGITGPGKLYQIFRQFMTLQVWEDCIDGPPGAGCTFFPVASDSLVADNRGEVGIAYRDSVFTLASSLVIDGRPDNSNTDAVHTITLTADPGNRHNGLAGSGVVVDNVSAPGAAVEVQDDFVTVEWLEIRGTGGLNGVRLNALDAANQVVVRNCLVHNLVGDGINVVDADAIADLYNNVVYRTGLNGIRIVANPLTASSRVRILGNTAFATPGRGVIAAAASNPTVLLQDNISHSNPTGDFQVPGLAPASSHNLSLDASALAHSPAGGGRPGVPLTGGVGVNFVNTTPGSENLHLQLSGAAVDIGADLSVLFDRDIDGVTRTAPWEIGADDTSNFVQITDLEIAKDDGQATAVPGDPVSYAITVTNNGPPTVSSVYVTDLLPAEILGPSFTTTNGTYNSGTGLWIFASPLGVGQSAVLTLAGTIDPAATGAVTNTATVSPTTGYLDSTPFNDSASDIDTLTPRADLAITKIANPDPVTVGGSLTYTLSVKNNGPSAATTITVIDTLPSGTTFVSSTPATPTCNHVSGVVTCTLAGPLLVNATTTITIVVTADSAGPKTNEATVSWVGTDPVSANDTARVTSSVVVPGDAVQVFTVTSTANQNFLEWLTPPLGASYVSTKILYKKADNSSDCAFPSGANDPSATDLGVPAGSAGAHLTFTHGTLPNDNTTYCYAAYVEKMPGGVFSAGRFTKGRPFGPPFDGNPEVKWAFSTGASSLAPPGMGPRAIHVVSNDNALHSVLKEPGGGKWPTTPNWTPRAMNGPSQGRPSSAPVVVGSASRVAFLGSQDQHVYAIDADTGALAWPVPPDLGAMVQAAPSAILTAFGGNHDYILVGTRDSGGDNKFFALNLGDGTTAPGWPFIGAGADRIGIISAQAAVDSVNHRVYFTSYERNMLSTDKTVWCVDLDTGAVVWRQAYGDIAASPTLRVGRPYGDRLYVGTNAGDVLALRTSDGSLVWTFPPSPLDRNGPVKSFVMADRLGDDLYFATNDRVWSIRDNGGSVTENWRRIDIGSPSAPVLFETTVYVGAGDGKLHRLSSAAPGTTLGTSVLGDALAAVGSPTIDAGNRFLYVGSEAGVVYVIQLP